MAAHFTHQPAQSFDLAPEGDLNALDDPRLHAQPADVGQVVDLVAEYERRQGGVEVGAVVASARVFEALGKALRHGCD